MLIRLTFLIVVLLLEVIAFPWIAENAEKQPVFNSFRLPNNTKPISYDLYIFTKIHEAYFSYNGTVDIALKATEDTDHIVIHAHQPMDINITLTDRKTKKKFENLTYFVDVLRDFLVVYSREKPLQLEQNKEYLLSVSFTGSLVGCINGFCASYYKNENDDKVWIASTCFSPIYARNAFPCYDEPMLKAPFTIKITHGSNYTALSNMPADGEPIQTGDGMTTTKFVKSPPMSTYTVAFVISNYNSISYTENNVTSNVFSPPISKSKGEFALNIAYRALQTFENYFDLPYPLPKLDHISVPIYPASGMENWGLVVYKQGNMLPYSNTSKVYNLQRANLIAHEIAHQWFGNLVTPKWWTYTWLNEGLSTFYAFKVFDMLYPDWKSMDYGLFVEGAAFWNSSQIGPMAKYVENEGEILSSFRKIFYIKGYKLMRWLEHILGEKTFKKGIITYLKKYQYLSVEESDLFESMQLAATQDKISFFEVEGTVATIMSSWTQKGEIPWVTVRRDYENGTFQLQQDSSTESLWWIPINFATSSEPNFDETTTDITFPNERDFIVDPNLINRTLQKDDWLVLNKQQIGMYRVQYDERNWNLIIEALKNDPKIIHSYNKVQLLRDAAFFQKVSLLPSKTFFNLLTYLEHEDDILPWHEAIQIFNDIFGKLNNSIGIYFFKYFARKMAANIYKSVGTELRPSDLPMMEQFRAELFSFACKIGLENCTKIVEDKLERFMNETEISDPLMKTAIFCEHLKNFKENETVDFIERLLSKKISSYDEGKQHLINLLYCVKSKSSLFIEHFLNYVDISIEEIKFVLRIND